MSIESNIDLVVPYVDSSDKNWQELFEKYNPDKNHDHEETNGANRFRGQGQMFKYWFRCVSFNMPWIRKIHLIVQSDSQVPSWINRDVVHVVKHDEIIPQEFLPTFNSTAIEMFLWKIPGLSEKFIYSNDDFFVMKQVRPEDFFTGNKVNNSSRGMSCRSGMYNTHCLNGYCLVQNISVEQYRRENNAVPSFRHIMRPYLRSVMEKCFKQYEDKILSSITQFRSKINFNVYLYDYYLIHEGLQTPSYLVSRSVNSSTPNGTLKDFFNHMLGHIISIQDTDTSSHNNIYDNIIIQSYFITHYHAKCKYEL